MNLDKLQVSASIRSGWQAIDLGFLMATAWWRPLALLGVLPALLLFLPLLFLFSAAPFWAVFIIWWLKPFWERLPLYYASRRLFDEEPGLVATLRQIGSIYRRDLIPGLLWRRLSPQRAFSAPVTVLEGLKGKSRSERLRVLQGKYSDVAMSNQLVCFCLEAITCFGVIILLAFFIPDDFGVDLHDSVDDLTLLGEWFYSISAFIAMALVMPYHGMAGFALYLNRRIELEAWDIEISFRNIASRKQKSVSGAVSMILGLVLFTLVGLSLPASSEAATDHDRDSAKQLIEEVLQGDSFGQSRSERRWRFNNWFDDWYEENEDSIPDWIIEFLEWLETWMDFDDSDPASSNSYSNAAAWLKVMLVVSFLLLMIYLFNKYKGPLSRLGRRHKEEEAPQVMFGLDVRPQSLPADVPAQVLAMWQAGDSREALSLLYRASLSRLIDRHALAFRASHTEAECAALVSERGIESLSAFFLRLTDVWRRLAYGHLQPQQEAIEQLCAAWQRELAND